MNVFETGLNSDPSKRALKSSASSAGRLGLGIEDILANLGGPNSIRTGTATANAPSLQEIVFGALADAKIWTSKVAMHLDRVDRDRFFRQLDLLHDCDEWFDGDRPVLLESYKGFVRFMLTLKPGAKPSLALAPSGNLLAIWQRAGDRLTMEFLSDGFITWVIKLGEGDKAERVAGRTKPAKFRDIITTMQPEYWFGLDQG